MQLNPFNLPVPDLDPRFLINQVLPHFGLQHGVQELLPFGNGLINHTWKFAVAGVAYILQRVNDAVFAHPEAIDANIQLVTHHLRHHHPGYLFVAPVAGTGGQTMVLVDGLGYFRVFPFVAGSHAIAAVDTPEAAFEAAVQFGRFARNLSAMDANALQVTIPHFHDLQFRYQQFEAALDNGNRDRIKGAASEIRELKAHRPILAQYLDLRRRDVCRLRPTHHDTKISNVLFDRNGKGLCVIDLDTIMPGYFFSDVGDMMRTYLSPANEEEKDGTLICVRDDIYRAIVQGYLLSMYSELTPTELGLFFFAGTFMTYMQALRFLTDHINDDVYYGAAYPGHNLVRAGNQLVLLRRLLQKEALYRSPAYLR